MDPSGFSDSLNFVIEDSALDRPVLILRVDKHILAVVTDGKDA